MSASFTNITMPPCHPNGVKVYSSRYNVTKRSQEFLSPPEAHSSAQPSSYIREASGRPSHNDLPDVPGFTLPSPMITTADSTLSLQERRSRFHASALSPVCPNSAGRPSRSRFELEPLPHPPAISVDARPRLQSRVSAPEQAHGIPCYSSPLTEPIYERSDSPFSGYAVSPSSSGSGPSDVASSSYSPNVYHGKVCRVHGRVPQFPLPPAVIGVNAQISLIPPSPIGFMAPSKPVQSNFIPSPVRSPQPVVFESPVSTPSPLELPKRMDEARPEMRMDNSEWASLLGKYRAHGGQ